MANTEIALVAHLMRRAGFGARRDELESRAAKGYEETVDELLDPNQEEMVDVYDLYRYHPWAWKPGTVQGMGHTSWTYRMINTQSPLHEKMALFWHGVFATGVSKVDHWDEIVDMVDTFREKGLGSFNELLVAVAQDPAMIYWLDNNENYAHAVNENWGRELLELFSLGVSNYTEDDVRECSRAFTGWTITPKLPRFPMGRFDWYFEYRVDDHDDKQKSFLGHNGAFDGKDVIDIICAQPATAIFVARHLYNFFVADETPVPAWSVTPPHNRAVVETLADVLTSNRFDIRATMKFLLNSDFFKESRFTRLKSPAEVVIGTLRFVGGGEFPGPGIGNLSRQTGYMGQDLLNPPSVEGWHTGVEWINSGSLMRRTNFFADLLGDLERPGVKNILGELRSCGDLTPEGLVDACLDLMGPLEVDNRTRDELVRHVSQKGSINWNGTTMASSRRISELLQLIVATRNYQFA